MGPQPAESVLVCYGGDGTLLDGIHRLGGAEIPVIGINSGHLGFLTSVPRNGCIGDVFELIAAGAHNIDLVNPTHYAHVIAQALEDPLPVPVVWNSGGYDRVETLAALEGKIQIYLPDYKYTDPDTARRYAGAADYPETARAAIREMVRQTGPYQLDEAGRMTRGVILRHLLLPGGLNQAKEVMDWVAETFPPHTILFSLMSQYTPWGKAADYPPLDRRLRKSEIRAAEAYFTNLGLDGFTQGVEAAQADYIPTFDLTGV